MSSKVFPLILNCAIVVAILVSRIKVFVHGQYISLGFCPRVFGMQDFNITKYEGKWYEVEKYWFVFEATSSCVNVEYLDKHDGTFAVEINQVENLSRKRWQNPGITKYRSHDGSAEFVLDLLITQSPVPFRFRYPYLVVDTDYTSFTIKYNCQQVGPLSFRKCIEPRQCGYCPGTRHSHHQQGGWSTKLFVSMDWIQLDSNPAIRAHVHHNLGRQFKSLNVRTSL